MNLSEYIKEFSSTSLSLKDESVPWEITSNLRRIILDAIKKLDKEYIVEDDIAFHKTAIIEQNVVMKGPVIIGSGCTISANVYLRGGVFLGENVSIGPSCEIKNTVIFSESKIAHLNYVGDSIIGSHVNIEAGAVLANHYNEREEKEIIVTVDGKSMKTDVEKFGALVGDGCKVGANAVISPGSMLKPNTVIGRLELITS